MLRNKIFLSIILFILTFSLFSTTVIFAPKYQLSINRSKWRSNHVNHYRYIAHYYNIDEALLIEVEVKDGQIISVSNLNSGSELEMYSIELMVDSQFESLSEDLLPRNILGNLLGTLSSKLGKQYENFILNTYGLSQSFGSFAHPYKWIRYDKQLGYPINYHYFAQGIDPLTGDRTYYKFELSIDDLEIYP